jgi:hypothetical protein
MVQRLPVHDLRAQLETLRLKAIEELAAKAGGALTADSLQRIAILQTVLIAVREEIEAHEIKLGRGAETPLK